MHDDDDGRRAFTPIEIKHTHAIRNAYISRETCVLNVTVKRGCNDRFLLF